jgi:hypothetical protein
MQKGEKNGVSHENSIERDHGEKQKPQTSMTALTTECGGHECAEKAFTAYS